MQRSLFCILLGISVSAIILRVHYHPVYAFDFISVYWRLFAEKKLLI